MRLSLACTGCSISSGKMIWKDWVNRSNDHSSYAWIAAAIFTCSIDPFSCSNKIFRSVLSVPTATLIMMRDYKSVVNVGKSISLRPCSWMRLIWSNVTSFTHLVIELSFEREKAEPRVFRFFWYVGSSLGWKRIDVSMKFLNSSLVETCLVWY
jgi:hypothetical protein